MGGKDEGDVRKPGKRVRTNRPIERAAVRAVTAVFEDANMLVQPVDGAIDIGKDMYIDLTEESRATGEVIAIQVKGGESFQRRSGCAFSCTADDIALWDASTVPIFAVVHNPVSREMPLDQSERLGTRAKREFPLADHGCGGRRVHALGGHVAAVRCGGSRLLTGGRKPGTPWSGKR